MMCDPQRITFAVYELYSDGREFDTGKTFSISKEESNEFSEKFRWGSQDHISEVGIILAMFHKLYNFTVGLNGFQLIWDTDENGVAQRLKSGKLYWAGPRAPACQIGGNWWRIKRV